MDAPGLIPALVGSALATADARVGTVEDLLVCCASGRPLWLLVRLDDCALPYTFVPAARIVSRRGAVAVPYDEDVVRAAPVRLAAPACATREQTARLTRHYGLRTTRIVAAQSLHPSRELDVPLALAG